VTTIAGRSEGGGRNHKEHRYHLKLEKEGAGSSQNLQKKSTLPTP
jgi:hypothetical protein